MERKLGWNFGAVFGLKLRVVLIFFSSQLIRETLLFLLPSTNYRDFSTFSPVMNAITFRHSARYPHHQRIWIKDNWHWKCFSGGRTWGRNFHTYGPKIWEWNDGGSSKWMPPAGEFLYRFERISGLRFFIKYSQLFVDVFPMLWFLSYGVVYFLTSCLPYYIHILINFCNEHLCSWASCSVFWLLLFSILAFLNISHVWFR